MLQKGNQISFRPDIKIMDCTIRDGGLVNDFYFEDQFVKNLYLANIEAGVDYMEFGYKASKELFDVNKFGKWKFCDEAALREIVQDNPSEMKISVMADVGRTNMETDIIPKNQSVIDMIRVATYINTIPSAIEMAEQCADLGYETSINIMAVSTASELEIELALELIGQSKVEVIYLVDSYGSLYPEQAQHLATIYLRIADKYNKKIGIHAHNNQQLAFANTIEVMRMGVSFLDATMSGFGRGCGNCGMELLLAFLKNPKYKIMPILHFLETEMNRLKEQGLVWGYDVPYLLTGALNQHPRTAISFLDQKMTTYCELYQELIDVE